MRGDCGTENVKVAGIQRFLRRDSQDDFAGFKSFMYGISVAKQVSTFYCFCWKILFAILHDCRICTLAEFDIHIKQC